MLDNTLQMKNIIYKKGNQALKKSSKEMTVEDL